MRHLAPAQAADFTPRRLIATGHGFGTRRLVEIVGAIGHFCTTAMMANVVGAEPAAVEYLVGQLGADRLMSKQADGTKNGAQYVLSRHFVESGESRGDVTIIDDCTNIHFPADLERAAQRLAERDAS